VTVVSVDKWAEFSLLPLSWEGPKMTLEMEIEKEVVASNSVLRISLVDKNGGEMPIRGVTWAFHEVDENDMMVVGLYVAKPTKDDTEELVVTFEGFEMQWLKLHLQAIWASLVTRHYEIYMAGNGRDANYKYRPINV